MCTDCRFTSWLEQLLKPEADDQPLISITWDDLSPNQEQHRMSRMNDLHAQLTHDHKTFQQVQALHQHLSRAAPTSILEVEALQKWISHNKWAALAYICNELNVFPAGKKESFMSLPVLPKNLQLTTKAMANALIDWRMNNIETAPFLWPHFIPTKADHPSIAGPNFNSTPKRWELTPQDRTDLLTELTAHLNIHSTRDIGLIHRVLTQPVMNVNGKPVGKLGSSLSPASLTALAFVCVDLGRLPTGKLRKADLIKELISWRMSKPLTPLRRAAVDSNVLKHVQLAVKGVVTPFWFTKPPRMIGTKRESMLKADHWRALYSTGINYRQGKD
ncbi:hypothetical protein BT96DRAFT_946989 [Gymnopus androsaceus JB14]|uniref:Uncharacterized protein n=1 Tax=Gymnopus androsaceus JB14 TaxID=1447944 RepID=A0A6A4GVB0_9AGAR|nr:hypothetical protein BT96DRAFT_946989 [Gymnopus androsaceus JB14]